MYVGWGVRLTSLLAIVKAEISTDEAGLSVNERVELALELFVDARDHATRTFRRLGLVDESHAQ